MFFANQLLLTDDSSITTFFMLGPKPITISILIEISLAGKASSKNDLHIAPLATMEFTNSTILIIPLT